MQEKKKIFFIDAYALIFRGYYAFIKFGQSLGFKGLVSPFIAAWIGNVVFLLIGIGLFWKSRT